jgi:alanyl-tRNA synthetase
MKSTDIRKAFLEYFRRRGHEIVRSSSLIPSNDPTLLFTNAGMVQFKSVFLGEEQRGCGRAASCQKCMRAGGKHSDIENVGHTARHHTFFEMLGNFSFGDYFKKEAVSFAWELLTEEFNLPKDRLWVSVYEDDEEAAQIWREVSGLPGERIVRLGAKDNFWQMGDTGPCGPCSEIIIDQGAEMGCGRPGCSVGCECDRYLELWNLVFMQYNRDESGKLTPLPKPSIDTGMGIERITAALQGKKNNFDTDLFSEIISSIEARSGASYVDGSKAASIRVIADHIRAIAFLLADGLMPSNEGRGYVLRRVIRRASRHARLLGVERPVLYEILGSVASQMNAVYPELGDELERSEKVLRFEEERFSHTLEQGVQLLDGIISSLKGSGGKVIPGDEIFRLYDTYGFPLDLARDIAAESGLAIDEEGFGSAMEAQRERARASWVGQDEAISSIYRELLSEIGKTAFVGYETLESDSVIKAIVKGGRVVNEVSEGEEAEVFLDKTPFYGESGGQVGDTGSMQGEGMRLNVIDTKKPLEGMISHVIKVKKGRLQVWMKMRCSVDEERRKAIMKNHTATHLLQGALRIVLGEHVKQAGSLVEPERLRFDFTHFSQPTREELRELEDIVNEKILDNIGLESKEMELREAVSSGAMALFGEKYGEKVRVVGVPGFSSELCGGSHAGATGDIGIFKITSEGSVASGIRRIEAVTGKGALKYIRAGEEELKGISEALKTGERPLDKVRGMLDEIKTLQKQIEKFKGSEAKDISVELAGKARSVNGIKVVSGRVDGFDQRELRDIADHVRDRLGSGLIVLGSVKDEQASLIAMVTGDLIKSFNAGRILKEVAASAGGKGGGKADMAQGGTKEIGLLDTALEKVYDIVKGK